MLCERIDCANREQINAFIKRQWYTSTMIVRGKEIDMTTIEGFFFREDNAIIGLATYIVYDGTLEIISLDSMKANRGIGSALIEIIMKEARERRCQRVVLITTNDNINAIRFYQKRGFDMARLFRNAMEASRRLKPEIPLIGENGIPLRHEIEFERMV